VRFVGPRNAAKSSVKADIANLEQLPKQLATPTWIVLSGATSDSTAADPVAIRATVAWLRKLKPAKDVLHVITICSGALLAAQAGLLQQYEATTHHEHLNDLAKVAPTCRVVSNRVFVKDGPIYSSAGVTTGIDLALHLISDVCGAAIAARVAQTMVVGWRRGAHDPELSPLLEHRAHLHPAIHRVQDAVSERPTLDWSVARMARVSHTSTRHLTRVFLEHTGVTPLQYLRSIRLHLAELSLRAGHSVTRAAEIAGFRSDTQLRRAWHDLGKTGTPSRTVRTAE
jgi:transcriptional regulator GlxA family with amidase domain